MFGTQRQAVDEDDPRQVKENWFYFLGQLEHTIHSISPGDPDAALRGVCELIAAKRNELGHPAQGDQHGAGATVPGDEATQYVNCSNVDVGFLSNPVIYRDPFKSVSTSEPRAHVDPKSMTPTPDEVATLIEALRLSAAKLASGPVSLDATLQLHNAFSSLSSIDDSMRRPDSESTSLESGRQGPRSSGTVREQYYERNFPMYRKLFSYNTQSRGIFSRTKHRMGSALSSAISPEATHFALCSDIGQWVVYTIPNDFNENPTPLHSGLVAQPVPRSPDGTHHFVCMNERWLVIGFDSCLRVFALEDGQEIYSNDLSFNIQALSVSKEGSYIACSIVGWNKEANENNPMVVLVCPNTEVSDVSAFAHADTVTFSTPYKDAIRTIEVSDDELHVMCSTEHRFFVLSLRDVRQPRVVMRSHRKPETEGDYEGITSTTFFRSVSGIVITSVASGSPPLVLDSRISTGKAPFQPSPAARRPSATGQRSAQGSFSSSTSSHTQPSVMMRVDKVGTAIHGATVSPRFDTVAFLDKCGLVYVMRWPKSQEAGRKIVVCCEASGARTFRKAAAMRFSHDGTVLFILDRKGTFYICDFAAGTSQDPGMDKLRILS